jgi:hypothetical protein
MSPSGACMFVLVCVYSTYGRIAKFRHVYNERNHSQEVRLLQANLEYKYTVSIRETSPLVTT